jgi:hypothetical protein
MTLFGFSAILLFSDSEESPPPENILGRAGFARPHLTLFQPLTAENCGLWKS